MSILPVIGVFFFSIILGAIMEYRFKLFFWTIMIFAAIMTTAIIIAPNAEMSTPSTGQFIAEIIAAIIGNITGKMLMKQYKEEK